MLTYKSNENGNRLQMRNFKGELELTMYKNISAMTGNNHMAKISLSDADLNDMIYRGKELRSEETYGYGDSIRETMTISYNKDRDVVEIFASNKYNDCYQETHFTMGGVDFVSTVYGEVMC